MNVDYQRLFETQFELKEGERFCRNITIINDQVIEGREFFLVVLEDLRWGEIIETLAVVIEDEDCKKDKNYVRLVHKFYYLVVPCNIYNIIA